MREPHKWLSTSRITQYQGLLCENPHVTIEPCQALNPATLLPVGEGGPSHDCKEILEEVYGLGLIYQCHQPGETRITGCAVVMEETIIEASSLPSHWSAQWVELYA